MGAISLCPTQHSWCLPAHTQSSYSCVPTVGQHQHLGDPSCLSVGSPAVCQLESCQGITVLTCIIHLDYVALCWAGLGWAGLGWAGLGCAGLCCAVLCWAVLCCAVLCCAALCCAVLCCAVLCCAVLCCAVLCHAVSCCAVRRYAAM